MKKKMLQKELEELYESFCETATGLFFSQEKVQSLVFVFHIQEDQLTVVPLIPSLEDKDRFGRTVQFLCKQLNAVTGIIVAEAWAVRLKKGEMLPDDIAPSERPDRIDTLQVILVSKVLNKMRSWKIIREKEKHLEPLGDEDSLPMYTKFFGNYFKVDA